MKRYSRVNLVRCSNCGFVFSKWIPSEQELDENYSRYPRHDTISELTIKRYEELLERLEPFRKLNRILDVGCGVGFFLQTAKRMKWNVYGTEYTDHAVEKCKEKGIMVHKGTVHDAPFDEQSFDIITSFEVLEHLNSPRKEISKFKSILRDGGAIYLTTPNFNSLNRYILKENYNVIDYPEHLSYYTPRTIHHLFSNSGFSKVSLQTTGFSITRLRVSMNLHEEGFVGPKTTDEAVRRAIEKNSGLKVLKKIANFILTIIGKGDALKVIYKLKEKDR
jgi:2-polyprenyl-3-methyl-5-hydroxy-6-metoxy-1,4-benzoquinol methylase